MDGGSVGLGRGRDPQPSQLRFPVGAAAMEGWACRCHPAQPPWATAASGDADPPPYVAGATRDRPKTWDPRHLTCPHPRGSAHRRLRSRTAPRHPPSRLLRPPDRTGDRPGQDAQRARAPIFVAVPSPSPPDARGEHANRGAYGRLLLGGGEAGRRDGWLPLSQRPRCIRGRSESGPCAAGIGI